MASVNLTEDRIRRLRPGPNGGFLWDAKVSGFGVRITPNGTKSYVVGYRRGAQWKVDHFGRVGEMSLDDARNVAQETLVAIRRGADPVADRAARRDAASLGELLDRWMREHSERENRPATIAKNRALIRRNLSGAIARVPAAEVDHSDIDALKTRMRSKPIEFNRTLALLRATFRWATRHRIVKENPTAAVKPYPERPNDRVLSSAELGAIVGALAELEAEGANRHAAMAVRLLALTGWRVSEARALRWDDLSFDRCEAHLINTKTGTRRAQVPTEALAMISESRRGGESEFVFPGRSKLGNLSYNAIADVLKRACERAQVPDVSPHVLRASAATGMAEAGASLFALREAFGWAGLAMPNRYVKRAQQAAREAIAQHGARTAAIMRGKPAAEAITLSPARMGRGDG